MAKSMTKKSDPKMAKAVQAMLKKTGRDTATPVTVGPYRKVKRK